MAITLRQPYCRPDGKCVKSEGEWTLRMKPFFETTSTFTYNFYLNVDNAILASAFRVMQPQPGVGHPLRLTALLTEAGKPIKGLPAGSVRAVLSRPRASLGTVLSKAEVKLSKERTRPHQRSRPQGVRHAGRSRTAGIHPGCA